MAYLGKTFFTVADIPDEAIQEVFHRTELFKKTYEEKKSVLPLFSPEQREALSQKSVALVFFEPSTRSKVSFKLACLKLGLQSLTIDSNTSVAKGETQTHTLYNVAAMLPDAIVVRYGETEDMLSVSKKINIPLINAGSGSHSHPTQALLDVFTIQEVLGEVKGQKVLIVGDVLHSRVAKSDMNLLTRLGAEVGICAPDILSPGKEDEGWERAKQFDKLEEGLAWATVCMGLRVQVERHADSSIGYSLAQHRTLYCLDAHRLKALSPDAIIIHPGPFLKNVDFAPEVLEDPRCQIYRQVTNGLFVRMAVLSMALGITL